MKPLGIILAGGLSSRMGGGDKTLLPLAGKPLLDHVIERFAPQVSAMALSANGDASRFASFGLPVLPDTVDGFPGPLAGVLAGLDWAAEKGASVLLTVAADTPFFPQDFAKRCLAAAEGQPFPLVLAATPRDAQQTRSMKGGLIRHPTFGLWPVALREDLRSALNDGLKKVALWTEQHGGREVVFTETEGDPFYNVNTPDDLVEAERRLDAQSPKG